MFDRHSFEEQLRRINEMQLWDFTVSRPDDRTLLILGSNDFDYYHHLEAEFHEVTFTDLPERFSHAEFRLGLDSDEQATVWVTADSMLTWPGPGEYEIRASAVSVRVGTVYYYERETSP